MSGSRKACTDVGKENAGDGGRDESKASEIQIEMGTSRGALERGEREECVDPAE